MASLQVYHDPIPLSHLSQEQAHKTVLETSLLVPLLISRLHEVIATEQTGLMVVAGHWPPFPPLDMEPTHRAPLSLHPVHHRRSCISCPSNLRLMNCTSSPNTSALRVSRGMNAAERRQCDPGHAVSALEDLRPVTITKL